MPEDRPLLLPAFALGVLHTVVLLLVVGWLGYRGGALGEGLEDIGTLPGLGIFALLWAVIGGLTFFAMSPFRFATLRLGQVFERAALWGGFTGLGVLAPIALFGLGAAIVVGVTEGPAALLGGLGVVAFYGTIAAIVAFAVGGAVGFLFSVLDAAMLSLSYVFAPVPAGTAEAAPVEERADETAETTAGETAERPAEETAGA